MLEAIDNMDAEGLLKFLENKFDKMVETNEKLFSKISTTILKKTKGLAT